MILRKPYALLIKHFQKIHLLLLFLSAYLFYKLTTLQGFVNEFLLTESYNAYYESITKYINTPFIIVILLIIIISIILIVLLRYKKKPWKIYLVPIFEYIIMLGVLIFINNFFNSYNELSKMTTIMAGRDLLIIISIPQYIVFIIFGIRFLGIDLKKFGFKEDEEYLAIKEEDQEEFEVNIEFDKDKITRNIKKFIRNAKYVYFENKFICNSIITIIFIVTLGYTYYYYGVIHKTYSEGKTFNANYYSITVNNSYLTSNNSNGDMIKQNSKYDYLILNVTVKNNANKRGINIDRFRVMNKSKGFTNVTKDYDYFKDLGKGFDKTKKLDYGKETTFILVYKVDKDLDPKKYVLYYHDTSNNALLKKTKLNVKDTREVKIFKEVKINEQLTFPNEKDITITKAKLTNSINYNAYKCTQEACGNKEINLTLNDSKILELSFNSDTLTGEGFIDFSNIYAKIKYDNNRGEQIVISPIAVVDNFNGNYAYFKVPSDVKEDSKFALYFTFRDKKYIYHLN